VKLEFGFEKVNNRGNNHLLFHHKHNTVFGNRKHFAP
jgi:hypothetical protein